MICVSSCRHSNRDLLCIKAKNVNIPKSVCFTRNHDISAK